MKVKKVLCLFLVCMLVACMLPTTATAAETAQTAQDDAVTVYFTVERGIGFENANGNTMGMQKLTVPYFDLALYGLEHLYYNPDCYAGAGANSQKAGTKETAEGHVTILHLFIYATEVFRHDVDPEDAGQGYLKKIGWEDFSVYSQVSGSAFIYFWDYSNNVTYYLNYEYPLGKVGWGSTCDQIPLKTGDIITVRNDNGTDGYGTYHHFGERGLIAKEIVKGNAVNLTLFKTTKTADYSGTGHEPVGAGQEVYVCEEPGGAALVTGTTDAYGDVRLDTSKLAKGRYYVCSKTYGPAVMELLVGDHEYLPVVTAPTCTEGGYTTHTCVGCGKSYVDSRTPAAGHQEENGSCTVCGKNTNVAMYGDVNGDKTVDINDVVLLAQYIAEYDVTIDESAADVDGTGNVEVADLVLLKQYIAEIITSFPVENDN